MTTALDISTLRRRLEPGRLVIGSLLEVGIKAYGAGAAAAVALSDAETVGGKGQDALAAVDTLADRYHAAKYVADHRQEIQAALDHVNRSAPAQAELEDAVGRSSATIGDIETTSGELDAAVAAIEDIDGLNVLGQTQEAFSHVRAAWGARPDLESLRDLQDVAEQVGPYVDQVQVLTPVYYGGLLAGADNFASDEIVGTLFMMAVVLVLAFVVGQTVGFWVRRGQPGFLARVLQGWGARRFRPWYVDQLPFALSPPLYDAARERFQRDIVADPERALDPEVLRELELHFAGRRAEDSGR